MKRGIVDVSSVVWTCLRVGKDKEQGYTVQFEGKEVFINSGDYGYANAVNHLLSCMKELGLQPHQLLLVKEGMNSKAGRQAMYAEYKAGSKKAPEWYTEFNKARDKLLDAFAGLGSQVVWQDGVEADDVIGYLALNLKGERYVISNDKDLAQVIGNGAHLYRMGDLDKNPFGPFDVQFIPVAISLLGDDSDGIPGVKGFGVKSFEKLLIAFGDEGLAAFRDLLERRELGRLAEDVAELKELQKVIDQAESAYISYHLAKLRIDRVNTLQSPLQWRVGMVKPREVCEDVALRHYAGKATLVHADNYAECLAFLERHIWSSPWFAFDIETSTPPESDEWLEMQDKEDGGTVDVFGSELTGCSITFGPNMQYTYYLTHEHVEEEGLQNLTLAQVRDMVGVIPREKVTWVHNASFELPVCYNEWGADWKDDPEYHGFLRNVRDTAIASSYVDENESRGLKKLSGRLLGYEQTTYEQVTTRNMPKAEWMAQGCPGKLVGEYDETEGVAPTVRVQFKMNQLTAREVAAYGADDSIVTAALANHFVTVMELENTYDVFDEVETFPAYVTALGFVQGVDFDLEGMFRMEKEDDEAYEKNWKVLRQFLMDIGYEGTVPPSFEEVTPAAIKEAHAIVLGQDLKSLLKTPSKFVKLILQNADAGVYQEEERARALATVIEGGDASQLTSFTKQYFVGEPILDLGSPKQMKRFLYDVVGMPVEMTTDLTALERKHNQALKTAIYQHRKVRQGKASASSLTEEDLKLLRSKAKTDEKAITFALTFHADQIEPKAREALKALQAMKKVMTRRSLFYNKYRRVRHWKDGKIHASLNQCAAVTRRYSSSDPNLQQLPKKGEAVRFRGFILPHHKDAVVGSIDFAGQELRIAAERSQDKNMLACYIGDQLKDIHSITAAGAMQLKWGAPKVKELSTVYGITDEYALFMKLREQPKGDPIKKLADDLRKDSKNVNFAAQFGGQAVKLSETLIMLVSDAQLFLDARSAMFPDVDKAAKRAADFAERHGYALTLMGARRHLRDAVMSDDRSEVSAALRQAWNMEIQGSAGEMTKLGMSRLWKSGALHRFDVRFIAPVHDELVTSVHRDHAVEFLRIKHQCMTQPYATMKVPVVGSISVGLNFADQVECGEEFNERVIREAMNDIFNVKEAA